MAIASDAVSAGGFNTASWSHTCTGSNRLLFVGVLYGLGSTDPTGVTYNGVAMTKLTTVHHAGDNRQLSLWYLIAPATGSNTITVSGSPANFVDGVAASYTGCLQSGVPDASHTSTSATSSITDSVTVVASNSWLIFFTGNNSGSASAGTGCTLIQAGGSRDDLFDSNGAVAAGSQSCTASKGGSTAWVDILASFAPSVAAATGQMLAMF